MKHIKEYSWFWDFLCGLVLDFVFLSLKKSDFSAYVKMCLRFGCLLQNWRLWGEMHFSHTLSICLCLPLLLFASFCAIISVSCSLLISVCPRPTFPSTTSQPLSLLQFAFSVWPWSLGFPLVLAFSSFLSLSTFVPHMNILILANSA